MQLCTLAYSEVISMHETAAPALKVDTEATGLLSDFFSEEQLARELEIGQRTLHRWHREGRGPERTKLGKTRFLQTIRSRSMVVVVVLSRS